MVQDRLAMYVTRGICAVASILSGRLNVADVPIANTDGSLSSCLADIPIGINAEHLIADFSC